MGRAEVDSVIPARVGQLITKTLELRVHEHYGILEDAVASRVQFSKVWGKGCNLLRLQ